VLAGGRGREEKFSSNYSSFHRETRRVFLPHQSQCLAGNTKISHSLSLLFILTLARIFLAQWNEKGREIPIITRNCLPSSLSFIHVTRYNLYTLFLLLNDQQSENKNDGTSKINSGWVLIRRKLAIMTRISLRHISGEMTRRDRIDVNDEKIYQPSEKFSSPFAAFA
jgi:hypothetical protein